MVSTVHTLYHLFGGHCVYSTYNVLRVVERLRGRSGFLEIVFVGECEVLVCL